MLHIDGDPDRPTRIAAVDLGSNSFHMVVARLVDDEPILVDRRREMVRLAAGLDSRRVMSKAAQSRALDCLERFGQSLRGLPASAVRAVGTNTLRSARNAREFLAEAELALGHEIEIISGLEEARLIYLGVAHTLADDHSRRLVLDIGGGSTELIIGERFEAQRVESMFMGCVTFAHRFFREGRITKKAMDRAILAARSEVQTVAGPFRAHGWQSAVGASGTVRAIETVIQAKGWGQGRISPESLRSLYKELLEQGHCQRLGLPGLKPERAEVFPSGAAILIALVESLGIRYLDTSPGALREGVLYELLGRVSHEDVRERTIKIFQSRYSVDLAQADRVERTALDLFDRSSSGDVIDLADARRYLAWAARIHEIGMALTYRHHHHHGSYLIANSDLPGFSADEQALLAFLVRAQRRKFPRSELDALRPKAQGAATHLAVLLRLATLLHRGHATPELPDFTVGWKDHNLTISLPAGWLHEHSLTATDFEQEATWLRKSACALIVEQ